MNDVTIFKALGDPVRCRIMRLLIVADVELCGSELVQTLNIAHYNLSRHLKVLREAGLIHERRDGRRVYHTVSAAQNTFLSGLVGLMGQEEVEADTRHDLAQLQDVVGPQHLAARRSASFADAI